MSMAGTYKKVPLFRNRVFEDVVKDFEMRSFGM